MQLETKALSIDMILVINLRAACTISVQMNRTVFVLFCLFFRAAPTAYGGSQARVKSELQPLAYTTATATQIQAASATYTTAHGNAGSLTH